MLMWSLKHFLWSAVWFMQLWSSVLNLYLKKCGLLCFFCQWIPNGTNSNYPKENQKYCLCCHGALLYIHTFIFVQVPFWHQAEPKATFCQIATNSLTDSPLLRQCRIATKEVFGRLLQWASAVGMFCHQTAFTLMLTEITLDLDLCQGFYLTSKLAFSFFKGYTYVLLILVICSCSFYFLVKINCT